MLLLYMNQGSCFLLTVSDTTRTTRWKQLCRVRKLLAIWWGSCSIGTSPHLSPVLHYKMVNVSSLTASVLGACRPRSRLPCPTSSGTPARPPHQWSRGEWAGSRWFHHLWSCWTLSDWLRRDDRWGWQRRMMTFSNLDSENKPAQVSPKWDMKGLIVWQETAIAWNRDHTLTVKVWHPKWFWCVTEGKPRLDQVPSRLLRLFWPHELLLVLHWVFEPVSLFKFVFLIKLEGLVEGHERLF